MPDLTLERDFDLSPARLFAFITSPEGLLQWWGPEGMTLPESALDFTRTGPWFSVMQGAEGQRHHVSGHVTHVDPPHSVGLTWAWHDPAGARGPESHVTLTVKPAGKGARLVLEHRELATAEAATRHGEGWTSTLNKLARVLGENALRDA
ncbi:MAG TPA: SRPBCC domain-containing protein [Paracoccaceae bacterium]